MKHYLDLVPISAKIHKKQSRMSIFCIVLAVFLVTTIFGMADMFIRSQILQAQQESGNWHIAIKNISNEEAAIIGFTQSRLKTEYDDILSRISLPLTGDGLGHKVWPLLLKGFNGNKATLTFKMIMMLAMYIIETNPYIKQALQMTYSFVFLDEFQDTTAIQYAFVKECFWNSGTKVTSVGDNKQRIMVWAGAVKTIFNDFYRELNPKCIRLIMNHRSAPRLVALQKAMYESLKEKATEVCASGNWAEDDGNIALFIADNEQLEAAAVSKDILLKISNGVEPHDICILCKQKPQDYASAIIEELEKHGVRARIETGYQDLIKEPIVDLFIKFMICADSRKHPNEWTFIEELLVELWGISGMRENDTFDEMQRKLSAVVNVVKKNIQQKLDTEQWHSTLNSIIDFFGIGNIKAKFPAYKQGTYFMNVINQFESLFFEEYVAAHGVWNLAIENFRGDHSVPIMTIHKSKGLEYNAVYFIGLEDSAFWNFRNQPDEDRCTFFVALSRAKASVTFTFCKKRTGMKCPMQRHNAINEFFDLLQRPGIGNVKKCAVGKHPKSEKHGNTAQFSEVERSGTQENCGGIGSGCRLRLHPLPVLRRRQSQRVARIDPDAVVVDKNIAENDRFDLFSRQLVRRNLIDLLFLERGEKALHPCVVEAMSDAAEALYHAAARQLCAKSCAGVLTPAI